MTRTWKNANLLPDVDEMTCAVCNFRGIPIDFAPAFTTDVTFIDSTSAWGVVFGQPGDPAPFKTVGGEAVFFAAPGDAFPLRTAGGRGATWTQPGDGFATPARTTFSQVAVISMPGHCPHCGTNDPVSGSRGDL